MADDDEMVLAELLCGRLCHDLAGPVSALATGAEMLADEDTAGDIADDALQLLLSSATAATSRLRFFRLAFGSGGAAVEATFLRGLVSDFLAAQAGAGQTVRLDWPNHGDAQWDAARAKLLLNLVLLARDCLPRGGAIAVRPGDARSVAVTAQGVGAVPGEAAKAIGTSGPLGLGPRGAQGYYACRLAALLSFVLRCEPDTNQVGFFASQQ